MARTTQPRTDDGARVRRIEEAIAAAVSEREAIRKWMNTIETGFTEATTRYVNIEKTLDEIRAHAQGADTANSEKLNTVVQIPTQLQRLDDHLTNTIGDSTATIRTDISELRALVQSAANAWDQARGEMAALVNEMQRGVTGVGWFVAWFVAVILTQIISTVVLLRFG